MAVGATLVISAATRARPAAACATAGVYVVDAQIYAAPGSMALDAIAISREFNRDDDGRRVDRVAATIEKCCRRMGGE